MFIKSVFKYTMLVSCFLSSCNTSNPSNKDMEVGFNDTVRNDIVPTASDPIPIEIERGFSILNKVSLILKLLEVKMFL